MTKKLPVLLRTGRAAGAALALTLALALGARADEAAEAEAPLLEPGEAQQGFVATRLDGAVPNWRTFRLEVGADVRRITLELRARGDLDLFLSDRPMEGYDEDVLVRSCGASGTELITLGRDDVPPLESRQYYIDVAYLREEAPRFRGGKTLQAVPFTLTARVFTARVDGELPLGGAVTGSVDPERGSFCTYTVDVPEGAPALRLDLVGDGADLDLFVRRGAPLVSRSEADAEAITCLASEVVVLKRGGGLAPGRYYVDVLDPVRLEWPVGFTLRASAAEEPPAELVAVRPLAPAQTPLERAVRGTVELLGRDSGGSGVVISESGYLITNYHVVQPVIEGGPAAGLLFAAVSESTRRPPRTVFRVEVVEGDEELDLALCRLVGGRYGQPLPEGYRFAPVPLGDAAGLELGSTLLLLGYPEAGGLGSRVPITLTRGIVSGFEGRGEELHLKTDAEINAGNSGGAALDDGFRLVGFPTETITDDDGNGQVGYVRPLWLVPGAWLERAGLDPRAVRRPDW